jgi:hypothetical protein
VRSPIAVGPNQRSLITLDVAVEEIDGSFLNHNHRLLILQFIAGEDKFGKKRNSSPSGKANLRYMSGLLQDLVEDLATQ